MSNVKKFFYNKSYLLNAQWPENTCFRATDQKNFIRPLYIKKKWPKSHSLPSWSSPRKVIYVRFVPFLTFLDASRKHTVNSKIRLFALTLKCCKLTFSQYFYDELNWLLFWTSNFRFYFSSLFSLSRFKF